MDNHPSASILRELRRLASTPRAWTILVAVVLTAGFASLGEHPLALRLAYSFAMTGIGIYIAVGVVRFLYRLTDRYGSGFLLQMAGIGFVAGVPAAAFIAGINAALFPQSPAFRDEFSSIVPVICLASTCVALVWGLALAAKGDPAAMAQIRKRREWIGRSALLRRLPPHLQGPLSHLTLRGDRVEVVTDKGALTVPMRLADAIREADCVDGQQIHLYHWVAWNAVERIAWWDDRMFVVMRDGTRLPVSRSKQDDVRDACDLHLHGANRTFMR